MSIITKRFFNLAGLAFCLTLAGQALAGSGHDHGEAAGDDAHGHSDEPAMVYTHYSEATELFVEFPPLVVNQPSTFVAHFTRMDNFKPLTSGTLDIYLKQNGNTKARFRVKEPARTGIFLPDITAKNAGDYELVLEIRDGDLFATHNLGEVTVFANATAVQINQQDAEGEIGYLKAQQWVNPFAITQASTKPMRSSVPGFATVVAPADGYAVIRAPSDGYFSTQSFFNAGEVVSEDQLLGQLVPRLGEGADIGNLLVNQERARAQYQLAQSDVTRLQALFSQGAIPEKRLQQAKNDLDIARVELQTANARMQQQSGGNTAAGIPLRAPINAELVEVAVRPGAFVRAGEMLFTLASQEKRWLDIQVPEKFGQNIQQATGAWLKLNEQNIVLDAHTGAMVVKVSQQVNSHTRTVSTAIEYPKSIGPTLLGLRLEAHVYTGQAQPLLAIPSSAIIDDGGTQVVYVQSGGETFSRRQVELGIQDGTSIQVLSGIRAGEWVVSRGAYYVKLASTGGDAIGHGHAH